MLLNDGELEPLCTNMIKNRQSSLLGFWVLETVNGVKHGMTGKETMEFKPDGVLLYGFKGRDKTQYAVLTYSVAGNKLITDQPSKPRMEETEFRLIDESTLELNHNGEVSIFKKVKN